MFLAIFLILLIILLTGGLVFNFNLIIYAVSIIFIIYTYKKAVNLAPRNTAFVLKPKDFLLYLPVLFVDIIKSNINVAKDIVKDEYNPNIITIPNTFKYNSASVCYCVSVILTPGSIVLHENSERFLVHVLDKSTGKDILSKKLVKKIENMTKEK